MEGSDPVPGTPKKHVILETNPAPGGFLPRYLLALTPLFLLVLSLITTVVIRGMVAGLPMSIPTPMGSLAQGMGDMVETLILLTAPVGIYALFVVIGLTMGYTEMWTGSGLALGSSSLLGALLVTLSPETSLNRLLDLLYWIAYLILPASVVAIIVVIAWTEKFRRSITYTITYEGVIAKGGIWKQQERILPHHHIGKLVMEQGMAGRLTDTGTIIPIGETQQGPGPAEARREMSRNPLDCLFGIREPEKIMAVLNLLISASQGRVERQVPDPGKGRWKP
ncbi:MAG: PH domain-containing protein [Methanomicrobiales archaeon]|nr:PH domain-containing protein [Methanomicrobiales archaeon]